MFDIGVGNYRASQKGPQMKEQRTPRIAACGIDCDNCPVFQATQEGSVEKKQVVAKRWSENYGMKLGADDIRCDGCLSGSGQLFFHCGQCIVRQCVVDSNRTHCADCEDFPCNLLKELWTQLPKDSGAQERLEQLRGNHSEENKE